MSGQLSLAGQTVVFLCIFVAETRRAWRAGVHEGVAAEKEAKQSRRGLAFESGLHQRTTRVSETCKKPHLKACR